MTNEKNSVHDEQILHPSQKNKIILKKSQLCTNIRSKEDMSRIQIFALICILSILQNN